MDAVSTQASQTVEFKGHLIDSLTLSKVADQILARGAEYRLNDVRIGSARQDISSVNMTLFAENSQKLQNLIEDMKAYGAVPASESNVALAPCPADGQLPPDAFCIKLPEKIRFNDTWLLLNGGDSMVVVVDMGQGQARLERMEALTQGAMVVCGTQGVGW